ncbi:MAG: DNA repair protein RecN [Muribaculaceae bacterium]|nr:DNA repair protein RecN [Muribaculaceae bacterium]
MLESLHISNYALIDNLDIDFHNGFNIITGETGAGKSIILGALSLILGGRADTKVIRNNEKKSVIEAIFSIKDYPSLKKICDDNDIEWDNLQCILRREIAPNGRSRAFVNDSPVSLSQLSDIAIQLVDIHSQHQNLLLASPDYQLNIIDNLAGNNDRLKEYHQLYQEYVNTVRQLKETRRAIEKGVADEDFTRFQLEQLEEINLVAGEQEDLEREREILSNMTSIKETLYSALEALTNGKSNVLSLLSSAVDDCEDLENVLEDENNLTERLETARIEIQDIAETLSQYDSNLNADPQELEKIEDRLNKIYSLEHKHKVSTVDELIAIRDNLQKRLNAIDNSDYTIEQLEKQARQAYKIVLSAAKEISKHRQEEAISFAKLLKERALPLGMKNLQCEIKITPIEISSTGIDKIEFLFAFNKNQQLMPVGNTASGGEISRLMLSIKTIIADKMQLPSIIFDEVDTGVSGDIANSMGEMMQSIARNIQVLAITHLPQVASKGNNHYKVFKEDDETSTLTRIKELSIEERVDELALMLSGSTINEAARANARSLLNI